jgi:hypothetical protein
MNTLPRAITAQFSPDSNSYNALRKHWSDLIHSERRQELKAMHHLLYLALIGRDWRKGFTPPTNQRKLENGAFEGWVMFRALQAIHLKFKQDELLLPFGESITPVMLDALRKHLPTANAHSFKPIDFTNTTFPFDAYLENQENSNG